MSTVSVSMASDSDMITGFKGSHYEIVAMHLRWIDELV
ncbi:hypothetical protein EKH55_0561 [Sinorhizobium alkalisoli]|nr:hypothetical protein EKH55_0561 [Sinorhizobium alkalisoli]